MGLTYPALCTGARGSPCGPALGRCRFRLSLLRSKPGKPKGQSPAWNLGLIQLGRSLPSHSTLPVLLILLCVCEVFYLFLPSLAPSLPSSPPLPTVTTLVSSEPSCFQLTLCL